MSIIAKDIMTDNVVSVYLDDTLEKAISILTKIEISGLIVLDRNDELFGVITEKDILVAFEHLATIKEPVKEHANREVIGVQEGSSFEELSKVLVEQQIRRVPVLNGKKVVGIVSRRDLLQCILDDLNM